MIARPRFDTVRATEGRLKMGQQQVQKPKPRPRPEPKTDAPTVRKDIARKWFGGDDE